MRWLPLGLLALLACNLVTISTTEPIPRSKIAPASTSGWVAYAGRGVNIGAPANEWTLVPTDPATVQSQLGTWQQRDPSVANLFQALGNTSSNYQLTLMKNDGTAWMHIRQELIPPGLTFDELVQRQNLRRQRKVPLSIGDAIRGEKFTSPPNSQIINHQFVYMVPIGNQLYSLIFTAQVPDFDAYAPTFEAMALTFWIDQ